MKLEENFRWIQNLGFKNMLGSFVSTTIYIYGKEKKK